MKNRFFYISLIFYGILLFNCLSLNGQKIENSDFYFPLKSTINSEHSLKMKEKGLFDPSIKYEAKRFWGVFGVSNTAYVSTMIGVSKLWYSQFDKTSFHFINDGKNWKQMDKMGHTWTAYTETVLLQDLYKWAGLNKKKATAFAAISATIYQGSIEILDGQSAAWGASWGDFAANSIGVGLAAGQNLIWSEQKILMKFSSHQQNYDSYPEILQARAISLYGSSLSEKTLKDYNGQTYWLSFNPFESSNKWPSWLNIAVGTGINQVFGATANIWTNNEITYDFSHIAPYREFYLSLDVNLAKIQTSYAWLNFILHSLNSIKIPFPTLVFANNQWHLNAFYF